MLHQRLNRFLPVMLITLLFCCIAKLAFGQDVTMIGKDNLRELLGQDKVVVVDVRTGRDWKTSEFKIKGAVRSPNSKIVRWAAPYAKDTVFVLYCA